MWGVAAYEALRSRARGGFTKRGAAGMGVPVCVCVVTVRVRLLINPSSIPSELKISKIVPLTSSFGSNNARNDCNKKRCTNCCDSDLVYDALSTFYYSFPWFLLSMARAFYG